MSNSQSEERTHDLSRRKLLAAGAVGTAALGLSGAAKQAEAAEVGEFGPEGTIHLYMTMRVPPENRANSDALVGDFVASARTERTTLLYEWYFSEDGLTCFHLDRWENGEVGDAHVQKFGEVFADRYFALVTDVTVQMSDNATSFIREALAGLNPDYINRTASFNRFA